MPVIMWCDLVQKTSLLPSAIVKKIIVTLSPPDQDFRDFIPFREWEGQLFTDDNNVSWSKKMQLCHFPWCMVGQNLNHNTL